VIPTIKYFRITVVHKWFVLVAGLRLRVSLWRLIAHDWTKFIPQNTRQYGRQFFGDQGDPLGFAITWCRHQNAHDHHWEFWIPRTGHNRSVPPYPDNEPLPMPEMAIREMVADWYGASRAYEGKWPNGSWPWFEKNFDKIRLHPQTRARVLEIVQGGRA